MKKIIVYDFDKTIYNGETSIDFIRFFFKRNKKYLPRLIYIILSIFFYNFNLKKSKEIFFKILKDVDENFLLKEIEEFWKINESKIFPWVYEEIEKNKKECEELILISATPEIFLEYIAKKLKFDKLIGTRLIFPEIKILGQNCKSYEKVKRLNEYLPSYEILKFYSDSLSDLPLFNLANEKYYINKGIKEKG